jgi:multiple sugar transport system ATP-binding protein
MSVYDNIAFGLKMRKFDKKLIDSKVREAAKALNLEDLLDRKPKQLSGGQRQRVALGRAIVRNPKVFLMDEPLSNLDANLRVQMRAEIKQLHKKLGTTFIYVTHDQTEALTMGDRIVVLDKGKIQQADTPENIYKNPKNRFVAGFIGQMNFIESEIMNGKFKIENTEFTAPNNVPEGKIIIGIRAEKMTEGYKVLTVKVDMTEMVGGERIAYFKLNGAPCTAKVPLSYVIGDSVEIKISEDDMYFFDSETGDNISYSKS